LSTLDKTSKVDNTLAIAADMKVEHTVVVSVMKSLLSDEYAKETEIVTDVWNITAEGKTVLELGSPEARIFTLVPDGGASKNDLDAKAEQLFGDAKVPSFLSSILLSFFPSFLLPPFPPPPCPFFRASFSLSSTISFLPSIVFFRPSFSSAISSLPACLPSFLPSFLPAFLPSIIPPLLSIISFRHFFPPIPSCLPLFLPSFYKGGQSRLRRVYEKEVGGEGQGQW
jgi:hypothetical protein